MVNLLSSVARGNVPTIFNPHWAKGHGLEIGLRFPSGWWIFGECFWHWSHFFTYSVASLCIFGHRPPIWLPQIPPCNSVKRPSTSLGWRHNRYGPPNDCRYNLLSLDNQNLAEVLRFFSTSFASLDRTLSVINDTIGSIQHELGVDTTDTHCWRSMLSWFSTSTGNIRGTQSSKDKTKVAK